MRSVPFISHALLPFLVECASYIALWHCVFFLYSLFHFRGRTGWLRLAIHGPAHALLFTSKKSVFVQIIGLVVYLLHPVFMFTSTICLLIGVRVLPHGYENCILFEYEPLSTAVWLAALFFGIFFYIPAKNVFRQEPDPKTDPDIMESYRSAQAVINGHGQSKVSPAPAPSIGSSPADIHLQYLSYVLGNIVTRLEKTDRGIFLPSAKDDILEEAQKYFDDSREEAATWGPDFDYVSTAYILLFNISFDLLTSGRYHIAPGMINPSSSAPNLRRFISASLDWAVDHGTITAEQKAEQLSMLAQGIAAAG